jgi:hypothetical protein
MILNFLVQSDSRPGGREPIDVVRHGEVDLVLLAARGMGMQRDERRSTRALARLRRLTSKSAGRRTSFSSR